jgi:2-polyprenyl-3-methyl-5-hydroxy-6-metoxy-1,4-benzoquinol methylase
VKVKNISNPDLPSCDSFNTEQKFIDQLLKYLKPGASILDVGCGSGYL